LHQTVDELPMLARSIRRLATDVDTNLAMLSEALRENAAAATSDLNALGETISDVRTTLAQNGPLVVELQRTLIDVRRMADSIRTLTDFLERNPNALVVGKP